MPIRCFLVVETGISRVSLRRFRYSTKSKCPAQDSPYSCCDASVVIGEEPTRWVRKTHGEREGVYLESPEPPPRDDPRWPTKCAYCGYEFGLDDEWQCNTNVIYAPAPGNDGPYEIPREEWRWTERDLPVGAMYFPTWLQPGQSYDEPEGSTPGYCEPQDGGVLTVIVPAWNDHTGRSEWVVDSYCSNCTRRGERHHCWPRHGKAPWITVDKNGDTCAAGAGSIWVNMSSGRGWHGFLREGWLVDA